MTTISVWILVFYMSGYHAGGPAVIDNISTMEECQRISKLIPSDSYKNSARCIEVRKVKQ